MSIKNASASAKVISQLAESKDGYLFDKYTNNWVLNKDITISFQPRLLGINSKLLLGFRQALAKYAEELSASHTQNMHMMFRDLVTVTNLSTLNIESILNWKAALGKDKEYKLGMLRGFLISWFDYEYYGVTADIVELLESFTLSGNNKGVAVANRCPFSGAFTENEILAINEELINLWREEEISYTCYAYVNLVQSTARRPIQLRQLKACDLVKKYQNGSTNYSLNIPRAKQQGIGFRGAFKELDITEDLYLILLNLIQYQTKKIEEVLNLTLDINQKKLVPIFTDFDMLEKINLSATSFEKSIFESDILHIATKELSTLYMNVFRKKQRAISERTADIIHITARRFRRTRGTNLGRKGIGARIIAEALDQSDSQNAKVYTENTADTVQYIDKAVGKQLAPFAKAFLGKVIEKLEDGERGEDVTAHIPNNENEAIGACGTNDFCVNGYEACYVCRKFRPLVDAPHEKVLAELYKEKEEKIKKTGSIQYASVKDRLIFAVEQVVEKCNEIKSSRMANND